MRKYLGLELDIESIPKDRKNAETASILNFTYILQGLFDLLPFRI